MLNIETGSFVSGNINNHPPDWVRWRLRTSARSWTSRPHARPLYKTAPPRFPSTLFFRFFFHSLRPSSLLFSFSFCYYLFFDKLASTVRTIRKYSGCFFENDSTEAAGDLTRRRRRLRTSSLLPFLSLLLLSFLHFHPTDTPNIMCTLCSQITGPIALPSNRKLRNRQRDPNRIHQLRPLPPGAPRILPPPRARRDRPRRLLFSGLSARFDRSGDVGGVL